MLKNNLARLAPAVTRALEEAASKRARRKAEERIARLTRVLQMLSGINAAVVRIRDRTQLFEEACRIAHDVGGYAAAFVAIIDPPTNEVTDFVVSTGGFFGRDPCVPFSQAGT